MNAIILGLIFICSFLSLFLSPISQSLLTAVGSISNNQHMLRELLKFCELKFNFYIFWCGTKCQLFVWCFACGKQVLKLVLIPLPHTNIQSESLCFQNATKWLPKSHIMLPKILKNGFLAVRAPPPVLSVYLSVCLCQSSCLAPSPTP